MLLSRFVDRAALDIWRVLINVGSASYTLEVRLVTCAEIVTKRAQHSNMLHVTITSSIRVSECFRLSSASHLNTGRQLPHHPHTLCLSKRGLAISNLRFYGSEYDVYGVVADTLSASIFLSRSTHVFPVPKFACINRSWKHLS